MSEQPRLSLYIPQPSRRPGDPPDFSNLRPPAAGETDRPPIDVDAGDIRDLAYGLIRVLDNTGAASGPWDPKLDPERLRIGLRTMMMTRALDDRMYRAQRQGKITFYAKSAGEEAIAAGQALALRPGDMGFPTYRQQGFLIARGYPVRRMIDQVYSDRLDPMRGRQLPCLYSSRAHDFFTVSGNLGTQYSQAVGWAMASAYRGDDKIAAAWIGDGATAESDFHEALTFASVYHAPVVLNIVNNQWAISSFQGFAGGERTTFAARAIGYGLAALRVDGNDLLAVYAATAWAAERARANLGATVIELFTYRAESHSTSDDPTRYRPVDEAKAWPLGDPILRLKDHLVALGEWTEAQHKALAAELDGEVRMAQREAEAEGSYAQADPTAKAEAMFTDVYAQIPWHLAEQAKAMEDEAS
jgi:2-oxoisovalerate dehydrogenase E1 component alpha subunit